MPMVNLYLSSRIFECVEKLREVKSPALYIKDLICESLNIQKDSDFDSFKCMRCGNEWLPRVRDPRYCPACKSPSWNSAPVSRTMYEGLTELQVGETIKLQFSGIPDPRPMRAVNYQKRRYGKAFRVEGKGQYLIVTRIEPRPVAPIGKSVKVALVAPPPVAPENIDGDLPV